MNAPALEDMPASDARSYLADLIKAQSGPAHAYAALRNWTWRTLTSRRFAELGEWHDLIRSISALLQREHPTEASKLRVLSELVLQTIQFAAANSAQDVRRREHVEEIVSFLSTQPGKSASREELLRHSGLQQANLSRVLSIMEAHGMIQRVQEGKRVRVSLPESVNPDVRAAEAPQAAAQDDAARIRIVQLDNQRVLGPRQKRRLKGQLVPGYFVLPVKHEGQLAGANIRRLDEKSAPYFGGKITDDSGALSPKYSQCAEAFS